MPEATLVEAINLALARAMADDQRVILLGEDIGKDGGVFRATDGLLARFGPERVLDTPLAEAAIAGVSIGLAAQGFRPVAEIQFMGFAYATIDQLLNHAARLRTPDARPPHLSDGDAHAVRRRHPCTGASLRKRRGVLYQHSRPARRHPILATTWLWAAAGGHPRS